jgi:hypothetical protein
VKRNLIVDRVELRARFGELEFEVSLDPYSGRVTARVPFPSRVGPLRLKYDRNAVAEPLSDPNQPELGGNYRVFVGRGVFVEGEVSEVHESLTTWNQLAFELREELLAAMLEWQLSSLDALENEVVVSTAATLGEMENPLPHCHSMVQLLVSDTPALMTPPANIGVPQVAFSLAHCAHCGSRVLGVGDGRCPNCGGEI